MVKAVSKSKLAICISAFVLIYISFNMSKWRQENLLIWDCANYYLYLPATIVYKDLGKLAFYKKTADKYFINGGNAYYGLFYIEKNDRFLNKYAVGTCLFELPFFLAAHVYCLANPHYPPDGYSKPYLFAVAMGYLITVLLGLLALRKFLLRYFSEGVTGLTLILILFATNLYFYTLFAIGMSHPPSFTLVCFLLLVTDNLYRTGKAKHLLLIGLILGLIAITRPNNLLMGLIPLCWPYQSGLTGRIKLWLHNKWAVIAAIAIFTSVVAIQLLYYRYITGSFFYYSYNDETFNFGDPHIIQGLFSYAKGWFVYTPVALIALLGFIPLLRKYRQMGLLLLAITCMHIYIVFSWHDWEYGGGFSARALIELLPVVAVPFAMLITYVLRQKMILKAPAFIVLACCITLNMFQSYQLDYNVIMWGHTTKAFYWRSFGKMKVTDEDRKLLNE